MSRRARRQGLRAGLCPVLASRCASLDGLRCGVSALRGQTRPDRSDPEILMFNVHSSLGVAESLAAARYSHAFSPSFETERLRAQVPAVFASSPSEHLRSTYTFIPTAKVVSALHDVGFQTVAARQARRRRGSSEHARHLLRFRRRFETVEVGDAIPELVLSNSHDGTSAYQLRVGLFRPVCANGLMVAMGTFGALYVAHRGDVLERVVVGALEMSERFAELPSVVSRMAWTTLSNAQRADFVTRALALRYGDTVPDGRCWILCRWPVGVRADATRSHATRLRCCTGPHAGRRR